MTSKLYFLAMLSVIVDVIIVTSTAAELNAQTLRIGIIGDQTGALDLELSYRTLAEGVEKLRNKNVDLILHIGDLIESTRTEADIRKDFQQAAKTISAIGKPWYISAGDHDVNPGDRIPNSTNRNKERLFKELLGAYFHEANYQLYYSFDQGGYHFIVLYSQEHLHTDPRWGNSFLARISTKQHEWLKADLQKSKSTAGTIIILHQPLWYNWAGWLPIQRTLRSYRVLAVVAGHFHYDQDDDEVDGIHYYVIGATGGDIKNASADAGGMHQFAVLELVNSKIDLRLFNVYSGKEVKFTPRVDADRVQAIDYTMDALYGFDGYTRFYLKGEGIFDDCASETPAEMTLFNIGNPIDIPVKIEVEYDPTKFRLLTPHFAPGICQDGDTGLQCNLWPGAGMAVSNSSGATSCFPTCPMPRDSMPNSTGSRIVPIQIPVWSSMLLPVKMRTLKENDQLQIKVRMTFKGEQGDMFIQRSLRTYPLVRCTE